MQQRDLIRWSSLEQLVIICGQYGFDERVRCLADEEISIGDYVLSVKFPISIINGLTRLLQDLGDLQ